MKITQQIRLTVATLAAVSVGASIYELIDLKLAEKGAVVVNQAGQVRGGTQRITKLELAGQKNEALIATLDTTIEGLIQGGTESGLPAAKGAFLEEMTKVQDAWQSLKAKLVQARQQPALQQQLVKDSENLFELTNQAVSAAEAQVLDKESQAVNTIIAILIVEILLIGFIIMTIQRISKTLTLTVNSVAGSSSQIAATVEEQGRIVSDQTASVNETTTTVEELGASSMQAAQQANASAASAQQALDLSESGRKTVQETLDGIANLRAKVGDIAEKIMQLSEQTDQISTVSKLVADVADQTNMLALNAAVEAARAGEQGKGFAVVAGEIRKLADQSRNSADKIGTLVGSIQASINSTVMVTDEGNKTADSGIKLTENTLAVFQEIAAAVNEVSIASQQIALSSKQQAVGVQQAVSAMNAINLGAKETATVVSQVKASTEELTEMANQLQVTV
jgi:methyl-accepting chemotaxis protein